MSLYLQRTHCNHEYTCWERILKCCWRNQAWINSTLSVRSCFDQAEVDYQFVHGLMIFLFFLDRSIDPSTRWTDPFKRKMKTALFCVFCNNCFLLILQNPKFNLNFFKRLIFILLRKIIKIIIKLYPINIISISLSNIFEWFLSS